MKWFNYSAQIFSFLVISVLFSMSCTKASDGSVETIPLQPTDLVATVLSATQVDLAWNDKSTNEIGFKIQRKTPGSNFTEIGSVGKDVTTFSDNGLADKTTYIYRVFAYNNVGASVTYSNEVTVTTFGPVKLTTNPISNISVNSAESGGNITDNGGSSVTSRGIVWSTSSGPTVSLATKTINGSGIGSFTGQMNNLTSGTTYYVRAYATNNTGTYYGNELSFKSLEGGQLGVTNHSCGATNVHNPAVAYGTMTDQEGNVYRTVQIGTQVWMAENLRTTKYRNGVSIPNITNRTPWNNDTIGAFCSYMHNTSYDCPYGKLYNWFAVNNQNKLCPTGWHVPTDAEWTELTRDIIGRNDNGESSASKMRSTGTQYWLSPNTGATNSSGFSGLPGGFRNIAVVGDNFLFIDEAGYWWSSTQNSTDVSWYRIMTFNTSNVIRQSSTKKYGFSVRCIKD